jgi:predicted GNAT family acetyltransferase
VSRVDPTVAVADHPERERYEITADGEPAGFTQYRRRPQLIALVHTEIDPAFEGRGLASILIRFALDDARARQDAVLPFCPFVNAYIKKHPDEYADLVPEAFREKFGL